MTDSFIEALTELAPGDGKRVAAFLDKLVHAPDAAGLRPEIVHEAGDRTIRSLKVTHDLRAIGHIDGDEIVLLYVGQHDDAYAWASKRCIECHPVTGEMQIVEDPAEAEQKLASHGAVTTRRTNRGQPGPCCRPLRRIDRRLPSVARRAAFVAAHRTHDLQRRHAALRGSRPTDRGERTAGTARDR